MRDLDPVTSRIHDALQAAIAAGEISNGAGMVTGWIAAISYVDADGEECHATLSSDTVASSKLGLLRVAQLGIEEDVRAWWWDTDE